MKFRIVGLGSYTAFHNHDDDFGRLRDPSIGAGHTQNLRNVILQQSRRVFHDKLDQERASIQQGLIDMIDKFRSNSSDEQASKSNERETFGHFQQIDSRYA
ncbi:hypothetical protein BCON_0005g00210 [Botryotinia convoluta]|uniref:Uncharacterized protein n=1 Tax=Botryotinia convoluta TaxID=54673 RepID=A0A4Z1IVU6_9HELO|nr:hypothetical protein BCON_0005g00210 [Botryotinia convoluta]